MRALRSIMPEDVPNCHGYTRAITVTAPEGTVVNPLMPAACGARGITGYRTIDCMFGALAQALQVKATNAANPSTAFMPVGTTPVTLLTYPGPASNDAVTIGIKQSVGSTDPLRTGSYSKTLTFTLSTTTP